MLEPVEFAKQPFDLFVSTAGACVVDRLAQRLQVRLFWPFQRYPARHAVAHRPPNAEVCGTASHGVTRPLQIDRERFLQAFFDEIGEFEVLEKHVEELFLRKREFKRVLARPVGAPLRAAAPFPAGRPRNLVAFDILLVAGDDMFGSPGAAAVMKIRLGNSTGRNRHFFAVADIGHLALAQCLLHRRFYLGSGARQETLTVTETFTLRVRATVDDVHSLTSERGPWSPTPPCLPAYTTRPTAELAARCSRAPPYDRGNRRASSPSRYPSCCQS